MKLSLGPGAMVAAAFVGPGTVTTATAAGAGFGLALVWAVLFSLFATLVLQELAARTALLSGRELATAIREISQRQRGGWLLVVLVVGAIGIGNAAYQSGNLSGAGLGIEAAFGGDRRLWILLAGLVAAALLLVNHYAWFEGLLVALVLVMALLFLGLVILLLPELATLTPERWMPGLPKASLATVLALIGTTVVPYNLFLHSNAVRVRWQGIATEAALSEARWESHLSIAIGGLITLAIVAVGAVLLVPADSPEAVAVLVRGVDARLPGLGGVLVGLGLFAAGLTSAVAAPLAAGWAVCGVLGWSTARDSQPFRLVAMAVLVTGLAFAVVAQRPVVLIITAQATNALLLPVVALGLALAANSPSLMGTHRNSRRANLVLAVVLGVVAMLAISRLLQLFG